MNISKYKVNCTSISDIIKNAKGNVQPTQKEIDRYDKLKDKAIESLKPSSIDFLCKFVEKSSNYNEDLLSTAVKKSIRNLFIYEFYGRGSVSSYDGNSFLWVEKGRICEQEAIDFLSKTDGIEYVKNKKMYSNYYFKGIPDIVCKDKTKVNKVIDIKVCYDLSSFIDKKHEPIDPYIYYQMQGYMDICKCEESEVIFLLLDMPKELLEPIIKKATIKWINENASMQEIENRVSNITKNMIYSDILDKDKIHRVTIEKDQLAISKAKSRVPLVRKYLQELEQISPKLK